MLRVKNIEKSLEFYTKVMRLEITSTMRLDDCTLYFLSDKDRTCEIELTYNDDTPEEGYDIGNAFGHLAFKVDSLKDFEKDLIKYGYNYLYSPFDLNGKGSIIAFVKDPDGYEIELIESLNI